jgi:DnaJ-class molecular chaperone
MKETPKEVHARIIGNILPAQETCTRCLGDGLEMCRVDGCDANRNNKCISCKGTGVKDVKADCCGCKHVLCSKHWFEFLDKQNTAK